jgi:multiple sugar transport system ATP-binding protein
LGIRPTHFALSSDAPTRPGIVRETVIVDLVQPTGARSFVSFRIGDATVTAEFDAHAVSQPGERLHVDFDMNRAVLIDPETNRIMP